MQQYERVASLLTIKPAKAIRGTIRPRRVVYISFSNNSIIRIPSSLEVPSAQHSTRPRPPLPQQSIPVFWRQGPQTSRDRNLPGFATPKSAAESRNVGLNKKQASMQFTMISQVPNVDEHNFLIGLGFFGVGVKRDFFVPRMPSNDKWRWVTKGTSGPRWLAHRLQHDFEYGRCFAIP